MAIATRTEPVTARRLIDNKVRDAEGNSVGEVEDFVIDPARGCIDYAVVSFGGFMGLGKEFHVIPFQMLQIHPDGRSFMANIQRQQIEHAPGFDRGNVPAMDDSYLSSVYSYWGVQRSGQQTYEQQPTYEERQTYQQPTHQEQQTYQEQPTGYTEQPQGTYSGARRAEQEQTGTSEQGTSRPWRESYRGLFWHGSDEER